MSHTDERREAAGVEPQWLNPAEAIGESRSRLAEEQQREVRTQGLVLRTYLATTAVLSLMFGAYFLSLGETPHKLAAVAAAMTSIAMVGGLIADATGHRAAAGLTSQLAPVVPILIYCWVFSAEAVFHAYLFIGALGLVVLVPEYRARTRSISVVVLVVAILTAQVMFPRERALAPLSVEQTNTIAAVNRALMAVSVFGLALLLNRSVRVARVLVKESLALSQTEANTDSLTGLPNRRPLWDRVIALTEKGTPFTLALADVDHFKRLNDQYGHECGDKTLVRISRELASAVRERDIVGRWGGEEFVVVLAGDHDGSVRALERVHAAISGTPPECDQAAPPVTVSIGHAPWFPGDDPWRTLRRADHALYAAKRAGRDRVFAAEPEIVD